MGHDRFNSAARFPFTARERAAREPRVSQGHMVTSRYVFLGSSWCSLTIELGESTSTDYIRVFHGRMTELGFFGLGKRAVVERFE